MPVNPFTIHGTRHFSDADLEDQIQIYRGIRDRLRDAPDTILSVWGQVDEALEALEDEVRRRRLVA